MIRLVAYIRRSTEGQEDSPETQRRIIEEYCTNNGHALVGVCVEDAISGGIPIEQRPVAAELFARAVSRKRDFDGIIVVRLDRLFRDLADQLSWTNLLDRHKCQLHTPAGPIDRSTPEAGFMFSMLGAAAEFERKITGRRVREHNLALAMQGKKPSGYAPLGLTYDPKTKRCMANDRAQDVLTIYTIFVEIHGNLSDTLRRVAAAGILSQRGNPITLRGMYLILSNCTYRQRILYAGKEWDAPDIPRIIPPALTDAVDNLLAQRQSLPNRSRNSKQAYSGVLYCAHCGRHYTVTYSYPHNKALVKSPYVGWVCGGRASLRICTARKVSERLLDRLVARALAETLSEYRGRIGRAKLDASKSEAKYIIRQRERLQSTRQRWLRLYAEGLIDHQQMQRQLQTVDKELESLPNRKPAATIQAQTIFEHIDSIESDWQDWPSEAKRNLLLELGAKITISSADMEPLKIIFDSCLTSEPIEVAMSQRSGRAKPTSE